MSSRRSKRHHIVPETLQARFLSESNKIWYSERSESGKFRQPEERNPGSAFWIRDYNTVLVDGSPSDIVEREYYGNLDNYLGRLLPDIFDAFADGEIPRFEGGALDDIRHTVFDLVKRSPDFIKDKTDEERGREAISTLLDEVSRRLEGRPLVQSLEEKLSDPLHLKREGRNLRVRATIMRSKRVSDALSDFEVRWGYSGGRHSFVLSSSMIFRIGNGGSNGLKNPNMEMWFPISPKLAIILVRDREGRIPLVNEISRDMMREINEYAVSISSQIGSASRSLLRSLI